MDTRVESLPCVGVVLAGGLSSRMGRDKAMLFWHGRPLIEHQLGVLRAAGAVETYVSGDRQAYHGIPDARADVGPLGGLDGIAQVITSDTPWLVVPVDMPLLTAALLQRLRSERPLARSLTFADHVLPMRLHLDAFARAELRRLLQLDDPRQRSLRALHKALHGETLALDADEATQLTDCNTPTQWSEVAG